MFVASCLFGFGFVDGHVPFFWLPLYGLDVPKKRGFHVAAAKNQSSGFHDRVPTAVHTHIHRHF